MLEQFISTQRRDFRWSVASATMQIRDRAKDLIKTGGEGISSIDMENAAMARALN